MNRRVFLRSFTLAAGSAAAALSGFGAGPVSAQDRAALRQAFESLSAEGRAAVQTELQIAGLYAGAVDGRYGRGTETALVAGAEFLAGNSGGKVTVDLAAPAGAAAYVRGLAAGAYSAWLYGEGGECDSC